MPAENLESATIDRLESPQPRWVTRRPLRSISLSLRQIMIALVYFAVASLLGRHLFDNGWSLSAMFFGAWVGLGLGYLGIWLAARLGRLAILGWILFITGYVVMTASMMGLLVIPSVPIVVGVITYLHVQNRRNQQNGLLWVLAVAAHRAIPLAPGVEAYSLQSSRSFRERAHALAALLNQGQTLSSAIDWVPRIVPWDAPLLIRMGEKSGRLAEGLREAAESRSERDQTLRDVFGRIGYLLTVLAVAQNIVGFTSYFVIPKFAAIFRDFGVDLPVATRWLISASNSISDNLFAIGLVQLAVFFFLAFRFARQGPQGLPIVGRLFWLRQKSLMLRSLALAIEAEQPIDRAFELIATNGPSNRIRKRIKKAAGLVGSGVSWTDALRFVRLISESDNGVLDAAGRAGNLPWALRTLAETGERRFAYRLQFGSHLLFIGSILLLGVLVLSFVIALFTPMVLLIERLAG